MRHMRSLAVTALAVCSGLWAAGCTTTAGVLVPSSHFVYPNSNVELVGDVSASKGKLGFFSAPYLNDSELEALYRAALAEKGGDILVNGAFTAKVTMYLLPVMKVTYTISGTAAKMKVGTQKLADLQGENLKSLRAQADAQRAD